MGDTANPPSAATVVEAVTAPDGAEAKVEVAPAKKPCRKEAKRTKILSASVKLFADQDYKDVLMEDVAQLAGVGKGTLYRYFKTKDDLFVQTVLWATDRSIEHMRSHVEKAEGTRAELRQLIWHLLHFFRQNDSLFHVLHHHKVYHACHAKEMVHERRSQLRGLIETVVANGVERGDFRHIDPHFGASILWGMLRTSMHWFGDHEPRDLVDRIENIFLEGVQS